jgi:hypothetical protein
MQGHFETLRRKQAEQEPNHHLVLPGKGSFTDVYLFFAPIDIGEGNWQSLRTRAEDFTR